MHAADLPLLHAPLALDAAIDAACAAIAPTWPLDRFIAVNPHWGRVDQRFESVDEALARLSGSTLWMPLAWYREAWRGGRIAPEHLRRAIAEAGPAAPDERAAIAALDAPAPRPDRLPLLSDVLDAGIDRSRAPAWADAITHEVSQFCASRFDRDQADWRPGAGAGLYREWRSAIGTDRGLAALMRAPWLASRAAALPDEPRAAIAVAIDRLEVAPAHVPELLQVALMRIGGWAAWCAYLRWQARQAGGDDDRILHLLAIRLAWEALLDDGVRVEGGAWRHWQQAWSRAGTASQPAGPRPGDALPAVALWHRALEIAYQQPLAESLASRAASPSPEPAAVQAVFCIDVRSEVFRRALETVAPQVQTLGFAGFFGLPISFTPLGTQAARPQLPGLLAPALAAVESSGDQRVDQALAGERRARLSAREAWRPFQRMPAAGFTLVEAVGLAGLARLLRRSLPASGDAPEAPAEGLALAQACRLRPRLQAADPAQRASLAERVLRAMSLTGGFAPLVLLAGHGSSTTNNPHAAGLDCGACCGQTGEVNARALAELLNDGAVREALAATGIHVPASTHFVAGLHDTTTDALRLYDVDRVPASHAQALRTLQAWLDRAGERARAERAPGLGLAALARRPRALREALQLRSRDWSQTRPEWGLADNAAFVAAPRARTRGLDLGGRVFLHEYEHRLDADGSVLELIMTAPVVVAHWINMQYHASTVDALRYGSGNKLLHNVVGGRIGVFEGNGGDLRIGLPLQSVHDGTRWRHTPLRLSVFVEAPRAALDAVIAKHAVVRQLVENRWIFLFRLEDRRVEARTPSGWEG
jgi:uncharacterized protein YbcC (UPF0753/DUF2309 family)